jgi:hypothetical protein
VLVDCAIEVRGQRAGDAEEIGERDVLLPRRRSAVRQHARSLEVLPPFGILPRSDQGLAAALQHPSLRRTERHRRPRRTYRARPLSRLGQLRRLVDELRATTAIRMRDLVPR